MKMCLYASVKAIDHPKMKFFAENLVTLIQDSDEIVFIIGIDLEKFSVTSLAHQRILCSEWVPSEWESKQWIKTSQ